MLYDTLRILTAAGKGITPRLLAPPWATRDLEKLIEFKEKVKVELPEFVVHFDGNLSGLSKKC